MITTMNIGTRLLTLIIIIFMSDSALAKRHCGKIRGQLICQSEKGPSHAGQIVFKDKGIINLVGFNFPPRQMLSCEVYCGGENPVMAIKECAKTNDNGELNTNIWGFWESVEDSCNDFGIAVRDNLNGISCGLGISINPKGSCIRRRTVSNGVVTITCRKAGCPRGNSCNVIRYGPGHPNTGTDAGASSAICNEAAGEVCTCSCV